MPPTSPLPIHRCLEIFGKAYSPSALLVLASSLALPAPSAQAMHSAEGDETRHQRAADVLHARRQTARDLGVVMLVRFALLPLAFSGLLGVANRIGLLAADPLRDFLLTMQATMPSAQNAVLALQACGAAAVLLTRRHGRIATCTPSPRTLHAGSPMP